MANTLLRSGNLDSVLALGERGQAVYLSAMQLRETLRLRKQQFVAECLAVPQLDDEGKRLDWYTTREGAVTSWGAASERARKQALTELEQCQKAIIRLCQQAEKSTKAAERLFGALLAHTLQFPDKNVVYLVGGKPVITFWGFVALDNKGPQDALAMLHEPEPVEEIPAVAPAPVVQVTASLPVVEETTSLAAPAPADDLQKTPVTRSGNWRYFALLPVAAIVSGVIGYFGYMHNTSDKPAEPVVTTPVDAVPPSPIPWHAVQLPLEHASVPAPVPVMPEISKPPVTESGKSDIVTEKGVLVMPLESLKRGTTEFLNGRWQVSAVPESPDAAKLPHLRYQFSKGKGTVKIDQGEGVICQANVGAAVMKTGNLIINSRTKARCSNGSRYTLPEITCKQAASGAALCSGQYDADTPLTMIVKRESKK